MTGGPFCTQPGVEHYNQRKVLIQIKMKRSSSFRTQINSFSVIFNVQTSENLTNNNETLNFNLFSLFDTKVETLELINPLIP